MRKLENKKCENCKHLGEIYFPPTDCQNAIHLKACFLYANEKKSDVLKYSTIIVRNIQRKIDLTLPES